MDDFPSSSDHLRPKTVRGNRELLKSRNAQIMSVSNSPVHVKYDDGRPTPRRIVKDEEMTLTQDISYHRPGIAMSRPSSAARMVNQTRPATGMSAPFKRPMSGTASRLASTILNQQTRVGTGYGLSTVVNVMDRPVTQQGLSGISSNGIKSGGGIGSGGRGPQRQVKDASYFMGILRSKVGELGTEINRLAQETEAGASQRAALALYDKRVKEMAAELTELQGKLSDYNLLLDRVNVSGAESVGLGGGGSWEAEAELTELKARNDIESKRVEDLFSLRKNAEDKAKSLSDQIEQEHKVADLLIGSLEKGEQMLYSQLQAQDLELQETIQILQAKAKALNSEREMLKSRIASSQPRQEAVRIKHQIQEAMERRDSLITSNPGEFHGVPGRKLTVEEERARLLEKVKSDNIETVTANQRAEEAEERAHRLRQDLAGMLLTEDNSSNKPQLEYQQLKDKEKEMEEFLANVDEQCQKEETRLASTEVTIVETLSKLSNCIAASNALQPSLEEIWTLKESVSITENKMEKPLEYSSRMQGANVVVLGKRIRTEAESFCSKIEALEGDFNQIKDLESVKNQGRLKLEELEKERENLKSKLKNQKHLEESTSSTISKCEMLKQELEEDAHWIVLKNLERKLSQLKQGNMALKDYIEGKRYEQDCSMPKTQAIEILGKVQDILKKNLMPSSTNASLVQGKVG